MTQQEIQERNKQIALMLGKTKKTVSLSIAERMNEKEFWLPYLGIVERLYFHLEWNWLMIAVEFIENIEVDDFGYIVEMLPSESRIYLAKNNFSIISIGPKSSRKEAVFIAVSDFAKLYNEQKL